MKILYVVSAFPKLSESFIINEIYELTKRGHEIVVFARKEISESYKHIELEDLNLPVYTAGQPGFRSLLRCNHQQLLTKKSMRDAVSLKNPVYAAGNLYLMKQLAMCIEQEDGIDHIHAHFASPTRLGTSYIAQQYDIPFTVTAHAHELFFEPNLRVLQKIWDRSNHIVVPSKYNKNYIENEFDNPTEITVIPATTDVEKFKPQDFEINGRLLTVGRLVEKKGHKYAIKAVAELIKRGYDITYHIVGTGKLEKKLRQKAQQLGVESRISFLGHVSDQRLQSEYNQASIFVLPCVIAENGDRDAMPVVLKEAMATKTACISTKVSAIPEIIKNEKNGLLVEPRDVDSLVMATQKLIDNETRRKKLAKKGFKTVHHRYDISRSVSQLEAVFNHHCG